MKEAEVIEQELRSCSDPEKQRVFPRFFKTAPGIVGAYLLPRPEERSILYKLAEGPLLWDNRIAVVSTYTLIKNRDFIDVIRLVGHFLDTSKPPKQYFFSTTSEPLRTPKLPDLMQKALGWMLRELGKRDKDLLLQVLEEHVAHMPRTMLRYAIEKFPEPERRSWLKR